MCRGVPVRSRVDFLPYLSMLGIDCREWVLMKTLYRNRKGAKLAGVCVGVGEHFDLDPNVVRLLAIGSCFVSGIGFGVYLAAWLLLPEKPPQIADRLANSADE